MTQQEFQERYIFNLKEDNIGGGSFGTVYKAYDNVLDREVAIKVSEVKHVGDKEFSLLEEFKAIENVPANKYIANYEEVYRFESFQGVFDYGLMQYYPLGNLSHYLKNNNVSHEKKESIVLGILNGISFLHKHKVVHRDLKPSNILVVDRKGELIPKITDFGLSKQASADGKASRFTNSFAGGTLQYSSPEQLKGLPLKLNTDLWSFGAIAYEILTGKTLFEADDQGTASAEWQNAITQKILHQDVSEQLEVLPVNWRKMISACLERDLNIRAKNTDALLALLNNKSSAQEVKQPAPPITPNNDKTVYKAKPTLDSNNSSTKPTLKNNQPKWLVTAVVTVVVIAIGFAGYFGFKGETTTPESLSLQIFEQEGLYGYKLKDSIAIPAQFTQARSFNKKKALVTTKDSSYYINEKGEWIGRFIINASAKNINQQLEHLYNNSKRYQNFWTIDSSKYLVLQKNILDTLSLYNLDQNKISIIEQQLKHLYKNSSKFQNFKLIDTSKYLVLQKNILDVLSIDNIAQNKKGETKTPDVIKKPIKKDVEKIIVDSRVIPKNELKNWITFGNNLQNTKNAANAGNAIAQRRFGRINSMVYDNDNEAVKWYRKAANQEDAIAQYNLGSHYSSGEGITKDDAEAIKWYRKAANQGLAIAQNNLGNKYYRGQGVAKDYVEAIKWFKKAADQGYAKAQNELGFIYYKGLGVNKNYTEGIKWYRKAADQGYSIAQENLGNIYYEGQGVSKDDIEAYKWFKKAANQDVASAQSKLGNMYYKGKGVAKDNVEAIKWYRKAANQGFAEAQVNLGNRYNNGEGVTKDYIEAVKWYRKAAIQGDLAAQYNLSIKYQRGDGVAKDNLEAIKWCRKSCNKGYSDACTYLKQLENN